MMRSRTSVVIAAALMLLGACGTAEEQPVQPPVPMPDPSPVEYPLTLWERGVQGETEVLVHIDERGDVDSVLVAKASGYAEFDSAALAGARRLRFTPGRRGDRPVAMWTRLPIRFAPDSSATVGASTESGLTNE